jgi:DNA adenine methylase
MNDIENKTLKELKQYCRDNGIKGFSKYKKKNINKLKELIIENTEKNNENKIEDNNNDDKQNKIEDNNNDDKQDKIEDNNNDENKVGDNIIIKPFLKWVGGKTQIINKVLDKFPYEINNYHELFLGGGSVLLALLSYIKEEKIKVNNKIYAYDLNESLINLYKNIQNNKDELFEDINKYMNEFTSCNGNEVNRKANNIEEAKSSKESYYYWLRKQYNTLDKNDIKSSALFIILNKLCFRGVYREGPNGFNVPYGHYKKTPTIITKENLDNISDLIKYVEFEYIDFREAFKNINNNIKYDDFVYLDPPYAPEKGTSFVGYTNNSFRGEDHEELFKLTKKLNKKCKFLMSNAKVQLILEKFDKEEYNIEDIECRRAIHSKNPGSKTMEVLISN